MTSRLGVIITPCNKIDKPLVVYRFSNIIQSMHSFEVDIRICQPEISYVHQGEAEVNITFEG